MTDAAKPTVLQVSTSDRAGGAEAVALNLHRALLRRGYTAWLAVGRARLVQEPGVLEIQNGSTAWSSRSWRRYAALMKSQRPRRAAIARAGSVPLSALDWFVGREDFRFPGTWGLERLPAQRPDVIHLHNLHGGYFDLRALPTLSARTPVVMTLHDAWLLSGHCAHSFDCSRWRTGCGDCPDLTIYPAIRRDRTNANWEAKRAIYGRSRVAVVAPSEWLMTKVVESTLMPAVTESHVIPYGIDLSIFTPGDRPAARARTGLDPQARVLLVVGNAPATNLWKDVPTLRAAVEAGETGATTLVILGSEGNPERWGGVDVIHAGRVEQPSEVAEWYRAADLCVHPARADTFPNVVLESLACGTPVVATSVGGIPEQIHDVDNHDFSTGALVPAGDSGAMSFAIRRLLEDDALRARLGANAAADARARFDLERQVDRYIDLYTRLQREHPRPR